MSAVPLTQEQLERLRSRRSSGESLKALASEIGITWQKLDKCLRHGLPGRRAENRLPMARQRQRARVRRELKRRLARLGIPFDRGETSIEALQELLARAGTPDPCLDAMWPQEAPQAPSSPESGMLIQRYRPARLEDIRGQTRAVGFLRSFAASPCPAALIFQGETGTGKTSAALALAAELGCDMQAQPPEFGGMHVIASGEQSADAVRELCDRRLRTRPFSGSGWKVVIVNEADRMNPAVETIWLDRLEDLPPQTVIVFTTNYPAKLSRRFRDRCTRLDFESRASRLKLDAYGLLAGIWRSERDDEPDMSVIARAVEKACEDDRLSFRRAVGLLQLELTAMQEDCP